MSQGQSMPGTLRTELFEIYNFSQTQLFIVVNYAYRYAIGMHN
jgi:hypothetical protein